MARPRRCGLFAIESRSEGLGGGCFSDSVLACKQQGVGYDGFADEGLQVADGKGLPYDGIKSRHSAMPRWRKAGGRDCRAAALMDACTPAIQKIRQAG
jgi:hypothetical protein